MPIAVSSGQAVSLGPSIYIISGWSDSLAAPVNAIQIYNTWTNTWQVQAMNDIARYNFYLLRSPDDVYWGGGLTENTQALQDLMKWNFGAQPVVQASHAVFDRIYANALFVNNICYLFGGYSSDNAPNLPFVVGYLLNNNTVVYHETATFPGELPYQQLAASCNGFYYLFGGIYNGVLNRIFRFDPNGPTLEQLPFTLMLPRAGGAAVSRGHEKIYLIGGYNEAQSALSSVEIIELWGGSVLTMSGPSLKTPRRESMAVLCDDHIYVFGGKDHRGECLRTVETLYVGGSTGVEQKNNGQPQSMRLGHNYPNPFNLTTCIPVNLAANQSVAIDITDLQGRLVKVLHKGPLAVGEHRFIWDGTTGQGRVAAAGVYFCRLQGDDCFELEKLLLLP